MELIKSVPPLDEHAVLRDRARDLAKPLEQERETEDIIEILSFMLNGEEYGVAMKYVKEVTLLRHLTPLPGTPDFILGIMSIRGRVVSVTDLRVFFNLPRKGLSDYNKIIVLTGEGMEFAILADQVNGVSFHTLSHLSPVPETIKGIGKEFLEGIFPGPLILIHSETVLKDPRLIVQRSSR